MHPALGMVIFSASCIVLRNNAPKSNSRVRSSLRGTIQSSPKRGWKNVARISNQALVPIWR
jgi:hypothetical protein